MCAENPSGDDVDLKQIAQTTAGFTGADLKNLINGTVRFWQPKENRAYIEQKDIRSDSESWNRCREEEL